MLVLSASTLAIDPAPVDQQGEDFSGRGLGRQADATLAEDLRELTPDPTDDLR